MSEVFTFEEMQDELAKVDQIITDQRVRQLEYAKKYAKTQAGREGARKSTRAAYKRNPALAMKRSIAWLKAHSEAQQKHWKRSAQWARDNPDKVKPKQRAYWKKVKAAETPEQKAIRQAKWKAWYENNKAKVAARNAEYAKDPEYVAKRIASQKKAYATKKKQK